MMDQATTRDVLRRLVGRWEGAGRGEFPTIAPFEYREILDVTEPIFDEVFHYRQQTWRIEDGVEVASHIETGFIGVTADGAVEILNAQGTDRVEALRGEPVFHGTELVIEMKSLVLAHDDRMIRSWRTLRLAGDSLGYEMAMATTAVPEGAPHLTAHLTRQ